MNRLVYFSIGILAAILLARSTLFVVDQRKYAAVFAFGQFNQVIEQPGLHAKLPWPFQDVVFMEKRSQILETSSARRFRTAENKDVLIDAFLKWNIRNPKAYFVSFSDNEDTAENRLTQIFNAALSDEIARRDVRQILSDQRTMMMDSVRKRMENEAGKFGIDVVDAGLTHVGYVEEINSAIYERMKAERTRVASELRATGAAESEKIRADADRQRTVILSEANRDAERIRGEGDAKAAQIYAQAASQNPEFFKFYRSLEAYRASFRNKSDVLVLDPNSEFFKYFKSPGMGSAKK
jgi:membrane protease subunit HflC